MSLHVENVSKSFRTSHDRLEVLCNLNLTVRRGESVAVVGESGVGKSTLIGMVAGYVRADVGHIECDGKRISGPGPDRVVLSQMDSLFPWLTVRQNAQYPGSVGYYRSRHQEIWDRADTLLRRFGLWAHRDKFPSALSGGQRRRVELVRTFAVTPRVLLLDEPYSSLDEGLRVELGEFLIEWRRESPGVCTLLVTHDLEEACFLADRVVLLGGHPASIVAEEILDFRSARETSLRLTQEYQEAVLRVRRLYYYERAGHSSVTG